uniref:NADH-ubiquinone oxidoreductase chain 2 n=1 Tax=Occasjapyx japonicus TaxID=289462 RepID=U3KTN2_9HEXA|nr:NADH dehydrogenase subunit 2 [Occasjapyx japonicus]AEV44860.1 NADH dehydrogenase subunit 2 [Occasjapyx japonicus]
MFPKPSTVLFFITLLSGTLMSVSSTTWMGAWMGLEINMLSFIPLISNSSNQRTTESSIKYFIIQAIGSVVIITVALTSVTMSSLFHSWVLSSPLILALLLKSGAAPLHFWFPGVMEGMNWMNCMTLMTWQSVAPLALISYTNSPQILLSSAILSGFVGALGGLNQTLLRKLMAYSSIGHMGWMLASMNSSETFWLMYLMVYSLLSIAVASAFNSTNSFHIGQFFQAQMPNNMTKYLLNTNLLSLGGLPPFLGFFPKWMAIQVIMTNSPLTTIMLILAALINLFYYIRLTFSAFITTTYNQKWSIKTRLQPNLGPETIMAVLSMTSLLMIPMIWPL